MDSRTIIRLLKAEGWILDRVNGSHHVFVSGGRPGHVVVVHPRKDTPLGAVRSLERESGVALRRRR
ncbi:type II toxin-antitoxin system HicA family toxin [Sphingomonas bacterium]|uniref:type II toxin-antitoxin system HicA family toxin n=1 Tax=Sphingomonas bacterium TaxID=1895847 RepID=UPI0015759630